MKKSVKKKSDTLVPYTKKDGSETFLPLKVEQDEHTESQHNLYGFDPASDRDKERISVDAHRREEQYNIARDRLNQTKEMKRRNEYDASLNTPRYTHWELESLFDTADALERQARIYQKEGDIMKKKNQVKKHWVDVQNNRPQNHRTAEDAYLDAKQTKDKADRMREHAKYLREEDRMNRQTRRGKKWMDANKTDGVYKHFAAPGNDFAWWNKFPEIMADCLGLRPNHLAGTPVWDGTYIPSVLAVTQLDNYGNDSSVTDPLNVVVRDLFLKLFQKYRGVSSYQSSDLGMVLIAGMEIIKTMAWIERVYGIVNRYSKYNYNMPLVELAAMGFTDDEADAIRRNLAQFRARFNTLISKAQRLCIPNDISYLPYIISYYGGEFLDHDSEKSQIIIYNPSHFGIFKETDLSTGSSVSFEDVENQSDRLIKIIESEDGITQFDFPLLSEQIESLLGSDSVQKIFGDLLAWFGPSQMTMPMFLPEDYTVMPVYRESILHKLHNTYMAYGYTDQTYMYVSPVIAISSKLNVEDQTFLEQINTYSIYQVNNTIITKTGYTVNNVNHKEISVVDNGTTYKYYVGDWGEIDPCNKCSLSSATQLLDGYHTSWSDEFVCEGLMVKPFFKPSQGNNILIPYSANIGTVTGMRIWSRSGDYNVVNSDVFNDYDAQFRLPIGLLDILVFDWYPLIYIRDDEENLYKVASDVDQLRMVSSPTKEVLDRAIVMSAFKSDVKVLSGNNT